jgi:hypothetical protein
MVLEMGPKMKFLFNLRAVHTSYFIIYMDIKVTYLITDRSGNDLCCKLGEQLAKTIPEVPFRDLESQKKLVTIRQNVCQDISKCNISTGTFLKSFHKYTVRYLELFDYGILPIHVIIIIIVSIFTQNVSFI